MYVLENVQKFALRVCSKSWKSDYTTLFDILNIPILLLLGKNNNFEGLRSVIVGQEHNEVMSL